VQKENAVLNQRVVEQEISEPYGVTTMLNERHSYLQVMGVVVGAAVNRLFAG
jgi:hypothetical protein